MATTAQQYWDALSYGLFGDGVGGLGWDQLGAAGQQAISDYYTQSVLPSISGQTKYDVLGNPVASNETYANPVAYRQDQFPSFNYSSESGGLFDNSAGYSPESGTGIFNTQAPFQSFGNDNQTAMSSGLYNNISLDGYTGETRLPQAAALYAINPQLAESLGITREKALQLAEQQHAIQSQLAGEDASQAAKNGWLMALSTIGTGTGLGYLGYGDSAAGAGAFSAGEVAAGAGAGSSGVGLGGAASSGLASESSFIGPATGADASIGANGAVVSAAPGTSTAGITTADLTALGGTGGAAAGSGTSASGSSAGSSAGSTGQSSGLLSADNAKLVSAAAGGLLGNAGGSKQAGTTTTTTAPWTSQQPYLLDVFKQAKVASQGSPITQQANANYQSVLSGPTSNPMLGLNNPYLQQSIDYANQDVNRAFMPAMTAANRSSGSYGNSGIADTYSKNMLDAYGRNATTMRMQDYTQQQNLQQQAVNNTLNYTQNANQWNAEPSKLYGQTVQGNYGGTNSTPYYENKYANILGGISTGIGLYNALSGTK